MRRQQTLLPLLIAITAMTTTSLFAGSNTAEMTVSARVLARTILTVDSQPASVEITGTDIARGYVDVPQAVAFRVRSNVREGYSLSFQPVAFPFAAAEVR